MGHAECSKYAFALLLSPPIVPDRMVHRICAGLAALTNTFVCALLARFGIVRSVLVGVTLLIILVATLGSPIQHTTCNEINTQRCVTAGVCTHAPKCVYDVRCARRSVSRYLGRSALVTGVDCLRRKVLVGLINCAACARRRPVWLDALGPV